MVETVSESSLRAACVRVLARASKARARAQRLIFLRLLAPTTSGEERLGICQALSATPMSAYIWVGPTPKMRFFYRPALLTLQEGLQHANISAEINYDTRKLHTVLPTLGPGDMFVWVGVNGLDDVVRPLRNLTLHGVFTVFYSTEADFAHPCAQKQAIHVREVWEYTRSNVVCCAATSRRPWRYVPPGYLPAKQLTTSSLPSTQRMTFIGSASIYYDKRRSCLRQVARGLMVSDRARGSKLEANFTEDCSRRLCASAACAGSCPLHVLAKAFDDRSWDAALQQTSTFLNVHKACNGSATASNAACESFRLSPLLSAGAHVFSEHCHEADEEEYDGLVHFARVTDIGDATRALWRSTGPSPRQRAAIFAERFAPSSIFQRAGLFETLAEFRASRHRRRHSGTGHGAGLRHANQTAHPSHAHAGHVPTDESLLAPAGIRPAYCK
jgi:hypothetical protein